MQYITNQTPFLFYDKEDLIEDEGSVASMFGLPAGSVRRVAYSADMGLVYQITPQKDTIEFDGTRTVYFVSGKCVMEFSESATIPRAAFDMVVLGEFDTVPQTVDPFIVYVSESTDVTTVRGYFPGCNVAALDQQAIMGATVFSVVPFSENITIAAAGKSKYLWSGGLRVQITVNNVARSAFDAIEIAP